MRRNWPYIVGGVVVLAAYVTSMIGLFSMPQHWSQIAPTPIPEVVFGVCGMMASLVVLILGFVKASTRSD